MQNNPRSRSSGVFCYFKTGSPLLYNGKLAGAQGIQRRLVGLGRNASAAIGSDLNLNAARSTMALLMTQMSVQ